MNYDVIYKKRTGDKVSALTVPQRCTTCCSFQPDGCAIFYKRHLFHLVEHHKIEFEQPGIEVSEGGKVRHDMC